MEDAVEHPAVMPDDSERPATPPTAESEKEEDVTAQLRTWRERSSRLETLLARKTARLQDLEDTVCAELPPRVCVCVAASARMCS